MHKRKRAAPHTLALAGAAAFGAEALPRLGQWVTYSIAGATAKTGRVAAVFAAPELWQRRIRPPTVYVDWLPPHLRGRKERTEHPLTLRALRPATQDEIAAAEALWRTGDDD